MLAPIKGSAPAAPENNSAVAVTAPYCDDCMSIHSELPTKRLSEKERILLANIETCPMCAFVHASVLRQRFKVTNEAALFIRRSAYYEALWQIDFYPSASGDLPHTAYILDACTLEPHKNPTASDPHLKKRARPRLVDYQLISKWLVDCGRHHGDDCFCSPSGLDLILGLQLIDCVARRIIPASEAVGTTYVTLSYVWGTPPGGTSEDVGEKCSVATLPTRLPRVVEDAIRVVKELGFRYLWVDKYCIPQNDESAKHAQIRLMDRIYARSAITIVAAAGDDEGYGLPGVGLRERKPELRISAASMHTKDRPSRQLILYQRPKDDINISTWSIRGWTYQEALLSRRRLVFTDNQVFFQCQKMIYEEFQLSSRRPRNDKTSDFAFPSPAAFFKRITVWKRIDEFLKRKLTFDRDALDAISGILNMYQSASTQNSGVAFLWGLPLFPQDSIQKPGHTTAELGAEPEREFRSFCKTSVFTASLLWRGRWSSSAIGWRKAELSSTTLERPRRKEFPSWTWVGWKSTSQYALKVSPENLHRRAWKCVIRAVYEGCEMGLCWEEDAEQILKNSALGLNPKFLDIKGTCFDVSLTWYKTRPQDDDSSASGWVYTKPVACKLSAWRVKSMPPNTLGEDEEKAHHLVALIFEKGTAVEGFPLVINFSYFSQLSTALEGGYMSA